MLPKNHYEAKKILCPVGMQYEKIHACCNDCILYRGEFAELHDCPVCGVSRYKTSNGDSTVLVSAANRRPAKVCWYLPIIRRFKRLFANGEDAKNLMWHANTKKSDGLMRHPADSPQRKPPPHATTVNRAAPPPSPTATTAPSNPFSPSSPYLLLSTFYLQSN